MRLFTLVVPIALVACGSDSDSPSGEDLYSGTASSTLGADGNQARCATCHATDGAAGFSGAMFKDIAFHSAFKGGDATTLLAAANACVGGWMGGTPLNEDDARWKSLEAFLVSMSDPSKTTPNMLAPEVLANEAAYESAYAGGNATAGAPKYTLFCGRCHDNGVVVGEASAITKPNLKTKTIGRIAQQVRTSGPPPSGSADTADSTPGPMPFFEPDELSAQDLKDIIAYLRQ